MERVYGYIGITFGVVLFLAALFANFFYIVRYIEFDPFPFRTTEYPYRDYAFPMFIMGVLAFIVGIVGLTQKRSSSLEKKFALKPATLCKNCGTPNPLDSSYCSRCGSKLKQD